MESNHDSINNPFTKPQPQKTVSQSPKNLFVKSADQLRDVGIVVTGFINEVSYNDFRYFLNKAGLSRKYHDLKQLRNDNFIPYFIFRCDVDDVASFMNFQGERYFNVPLMMRKMSSVEYATRFSMLKKSESVKSLKGEIIK